MTSTKLNKRQIILLIFCWIAYVSTYVCRLNLSAIMPEMVEFPKSELAGIGSAFFISYGISQIFTGFLGDKFKAHWLVFIGLLLSSVFNVGMGLASKSLVLMIVFWSLNGISQSMIWSPLLKIGGDYFETEKQEKFGVYMTTTVPAGTIIAYGLTILFIRLFSWNYAFIACGLVTGIISVLWIIFSLFILPKYEKIERKIVDNSIDTSLPKNNMLKLSLITISICIVPLMIHGALKDGVSTFVPTYIKDTFDISSSFSIALTMILPIINVFGAFISKFVNQLVKNELMTSCIFFMIALLNILLLKYFGNYNVFLTSFLLSIVTTCMFAVNLMLVSFVPLKFSKYGRTSTMSGIMNSLAYIGCSISMIVTGFILDNSSWNGVYILWISIAAVGIVFCFIIKFFWKKFSL